MHCQQLQKLLWKVFILLDPQLELLRPKGSRRFQGQDEAHERSCSTTLVQNVIYNCIINPPEVKVVRVGGINHRT